MHELRQIGFAYTSIDKRPQKSDKQGTELGKERFETLLSDIYNKYDRNLKTLKNSH